MVVTDDMVHARQSLVHIFLQTLQVLCLFVHRDDGVLQLHQTTLEGRKDGNLRPEKQRSDGDGCWSFRDLSTTLETIFMRTFMKIEEGEMEIIV